MTYTHLDINGNRHELTHADGVILRLVEQFRQELDNDQKAHLLFRLLWQVTQYEQENEDDLLRTLAAFQKQLNTYHWTMRRSLV